MYRTHNLGELNIKNVGEQVELSGWIQKIRNLGGMIFIDLRDQFGITQIVINESQLQVQASHRLNMLSENLKMIQNDRNVKRERKNVLKNLRLCALNSRRKALRRYMPIIPECLFT